MRNVTSFFIKDNKEGKESNKEIKLTYNQAGNRKFSYPGKGNYNWEDSQLFTTLPEASILLKSAQDRLKNTLKQKKTKTNKQNFKKDTIMLYFIVPGI